jgi:CRISPR-associated protein Csb2
MATVCISATFLTGRYHGEEWPPSPARLFQALVAGVKTGGYRVRWPQVEAGLRWLEGRPAPIILARQAAAATAYRLAVPNNDFDSVARAWAAGRSATAAELRTMKTVSPRAIAAAGPHVRYVWPVPEDGDQQIPDSLRALAECLFALGWGIDMAYATVELGEPSGEGFEEWVPSTAGVQLKAPTSGFLADLESTYDAFTKRTSTMNTDTRPTVYRLQRYEVRQPTGLPHRAMQMMWLEGAHAVRWDAAMEVAAWLRHASAEALRGERGIDVDAFVLGHTEGQADPSHRLSFAPLPSIGHPAADGRVRRVMVVEPPGSDGRVVQRLAARLRGTTITKLDKTRVCTMAPDDRKLASLYERFARRWWSVTPVILHGHNAMKGRVSLTKTEALLRRSFEMAGFASSAIESVAFQQAPLWAGTGAAAQARVPRHLDNYPRYHVEVVFRHPVPGPVLAGIGRHYGIGLFAALGD